ncbi:MAG: D-tyrosyl-tRNA(Tyr) deacylase [Elusimicrobia bacterium CG08_land_8_20_14_0_20_51_18]|nr:MAG: D-tyrosyl-tRNA(Tyr) deacylase [Elusimicrobia bacterium CG08_land_8_20_14_0_20_51_18]
MKAVIQRVKSASVSIGGKKHSEIAEGCLVLLGVAGGDSEDDVKRLCEKTLNLRIFSNPGGKFDFSIRDIKGELLVVSQFTLCADTRKGRRPDFTGAAKPEEAEKLYEDFVGEIKKSGLGVKTGVFGAEMAVELLNDGPVTIILDTREKQHANQ